jgi:hypothetical protein
MQPPPRRDGIVIAATASSIAWSFAATASTGGWIDAPSGNSRWAIGDALSNSIVAAIASTAAWTGSAPA